MIRLVVFDMAGTTVHDDNVVLRCFVAAAKAVDLRATEEELNNRMGISKLEVFDELARRQLGKGPHADALRDAGYRTFREILEGVYTHTGATAMRGAEETFAWLRGRGVRIALNTGFYREVTDLLVEKLGWKNAVDTVVCVDDVPQGRPAPYMIHTAMQRCGVAAVGDVAVVGDTPVDMQAGHNSGARLVIGVTSGAHKATTLRRQPLTHLLAGVWELPDLLPRVDRLSGTS